MNDSNSKKLPALDMSKQKYGLVRDTDREEARENPNKPEAANIQILGSEERAKPRISVDEESRNPVPNEETNFAERIRIREQMIKEQGTSLNTNEEGLKSFKLRKKEEELRHEQELKEKQEQEERQKYNVPAPTKVV